MTIITLPDEPEKNGVTATYQLMARKHIRMRGLSWALDALRSCVRPQPRSLSITCWPNVHKSDRGKASYQPGERIPVSTVWTGTLAQQASWLREYASITVLSKGYGLAISHGTSMYQGSSDVECLGRTALFCDSDTLDPSAPLTAALASVGIGCITQTRAQKWHLITALSSPLVPQRDGAGGVKAWKDAVYMPGLGWIFGLFAEIGELSVDGFDSSTTRLLQPCYPRHRRDYKEPIPETVYSPGGSIDWQALLEAAEYQPPTAPIKKAPRKRTAYHRGGLEITDDTALYRAFDAAGFICGNRPDGGYWVQCPWEDKHTGGTRGDTSTFIDRTFYCSHGHCRGRNFTSLKGMLPPHADAIIFPTPKQVVSESQEPSKLSTPAIMRGELLEKFVRPGGGVYIVQAETSIGKTQAFVDIAVARAQTPYKSESASGTRHADHSTTWMLVPTHEIAQQVYDTVLSRGCSSVRYVMSPLAVRNDDGTHACHIHDRASSLATGGQYAYVTCCLDGGRGRCSEWDRCQAHRRMIQGNDRAHITIGVHANLHQVLQGATQTALIVIDESYQPLTTLSWDLAQLDVAIAGLLYLETEYAEAMRPAFDKLRLSLQQHTEAQVDSPTLPLQEFLGVPAAIAVLNSRSKEERGGRPPVLPMHLNRAKRELGVAKQIGATSLACAAIERCIAMPINPVVGALAPEPIARIDVDDDKVELHLTFPDMSLLSAVGNAPTLVYLDANADLHRHLYETITGGPLVEGDRYLRYPCADGAPIDRLLIRIKATRTKMAPKGGRLDLAAAMPHLHLARQRILETESKSVALITFKHLAIAILSCLPADQLGALPPDQRQLVSAMKPDHVRQCVETGLRRWVRSCNARLLVGYYGNIRGSDRFKDVDHLVSIGDPRPPVTLTNVDAAYLALPEPQRIGRGDNIARAHLEQVHGRLRTAHRDRKGYATHIGTLVPSGTGWSQFEERAATLFTKVEQYRATPQQVRQARAARERSQSWLATLSNTTHQYIADVEAGKDVATSELTALVTKLLIAR